MKLYFEKRVILGFVITLAVILWLGIYSFLNNKKFVETSKWVSHTNEVLFHSEQILTTVMDMETSQRGYVLTNNDLFLNQFLQASDTLYNHLRTLAALIQDNTDQQKRLEKLKIVISKKTAFNKNVIAARKKVFEIALDSLQTLKGALLMSDVKKIIGEMQGEEKRLLLERVQANEKNFKASNFSVLELLGTNVLVLIFVFAAIHVNLKARSKAEAELSTAAAEIKDLYENAPCGYHSLNADGLFVDMNNTLLTWLGYSRAQIIGNLKLQDVVTHESLKVFQDNFPTFKKQGFMKNLEFEFVRSDGTTFPVILSSTAVIDSMGRYSKSRSTVFDITERKRAENRIIQLNNEMESFTYSVSHDLRAPLRSIDGYARILEEDYAPQVDAEGRRVIEVIMNNARRMGTLIDGLLDFSRISKRTLMLSTCDMNKLVHSVIYELTQREEPSNISRRDLVSCRADLVMIRQVWKNLISNALKFTSTKNASSIEIGSYPEKDRKVYYVKDDGVGFDMQYVHKLFGVFQRLHKVNDFEGTGVGLAIAHRIITKHEGSIWADAKLNEGATFFFSIPNDLKQ